MTGLSHVFNLLNTCSECGYFEAIRPQCWPNFRSQALNTETSVGLWGKIGNFMSFGLIKVCISLGKPGGADTVVVALWLCQCLWPMGVVMAVALAVVAVGVGAVVVAAHGASPVSVAI